MINERAKPTQRAALDTLLRGEETEPGATIIQVCNSMVNTCLETLYKPIDIDIEKRSAPMVVPGMVGSIGEPIRNPVTGEEHRVRINMPSGFEFEIAEMATATSMVNGEIKLDLKAG